MDIGFLSALLDNGVLGIMLVASLLANYKLFNVIMTREDKHDTDVKTVVDSLKPVLDGVVKNGETTVTHIKETLDIVKEIYKNGNGK